MKTITFSLKARTHAGTLTSEGSFTHDGNGPVPPLPLLIETMVRNFAEASPEIRDSPKLSIEIEILP